MFTMLLTELVKLLTKLVIYIKYFFIDILIKNTVYKCRQRQAEGIVMQG